MSEVIKQWVKMSQKVLKNFGRCSDFILQRSPFSILAPFHFFSFFPSSSLSYLLELFLLPPSAVLQLPASSIQLISSSLHRPPSSIPSSILHPPFSSLDLPTTFPPRFSFSQHVTKARRRSLLGLHWFRRQRSDNHKEQGGSLTAEAAVQFQEVVARSQSSVEFLLVFTSFFLGYLSLILHSACLLKAVKSRPIFPLL